MTTDNIIDSIDPELYNSIIQEYITMADTLAIALADQLELDIEISSLDILDCLATLGLEINPRDEEISEFNWPSLAYLQLIKEHINAVHSTI